MHIASTGGIWSSLVFGFGGLRDHEGRFTVDPRLPEGWHCLSYRITANGTRVRVDVTQTQITFTVEDGTSVPFTVRGVDVLVSAGAPVTVTLRHHGARVTGAPTTSDVEGALRSDGSVITATVPVSWTPALEQADLSN